VAPSCLGVMFINSSLGQSRVKVNVMFVYVGAGEGGES
jgi:hypothetical protein